MAIDSPKFRILLVGGLDGSHETAAAATRWLRELYADGEPLRAQVAMSAIAVGNPDGFQNGVLNDNGVGGNPARGYPPQGESYLSQTNPEGQYIWRWIGMHAPDLVIELIEGDATQSVDLSTRPADSLAVQLNQQVVCNVGAVPAIVCSANSQAKLPRELIQSMSKADALVKTKPELPIAREVMRRRIDRTPLVVAQQLAKVYGHELPTPAYIPAVACLARLRLAKLTGDQAVLPDLLKITQPYHAGSKLV